VDEVTVVAVAQIKPEHEERALELVRGVIEASHGAVPAGDDAKGLL
jgi:hypothetical protein